MDWHKYLRLVEPVFNTICFVEILNGKKIKEILLICYNSSYKVEMADSLEISNNQETSN